MNTRVNTDVRSSETFIHVSTLVEKKKPNISNSVALFVSKYNNSVINFSK